MKKKIGYIIWREFNFIFKKRKLMAFYCLIFPLIIFFFLLATFSAKIIKEAPVAVVDNSRGAMSKELIRSLGASPLVHVKYRVNSMAEAQKLLEEVKVFGIVYVDADYEKDILRMKSGKVIVFVNNQYLMVGSSVYKAAVSVTETLSYKYKYKVLVSKGVPEYALRSVASPISVTENILYNPQVNYIYFLVLGLIPAVIQLFLSMTIIYSFLTELKDKHAGEIKNIIKQNSLKIVSAKAIVYVLLYSIVTMFMLVFLFAFNDVPLRGSFLLITLAAISFCALTAAVSVVMAGLTGNLRMGLSFGALYSAPAFAYYGVTFPVSAMPAFGRFWSVMLPGAHFDKVLINEAIRGSRTAGSLAEIVFMLTASAVLLVLGSKLYSLWIKDESKWGPKL